MRFVVAAILLLAGTARADILGLKLGMTTAQVRAAKPCRSPVAISATASLACKAVPFAGTKMDAELWLPTSGLARVRLKTRLGAKRQDAEPAADAILDKLVADDGPLHMIGVGELHSAGLLFDNADRTYTRMKGKLKAAAMFTGDHLPDDTMTLIGKVVRDRDGYSLELSFVPRTEKPATAAPRTP
jgi:hypothetical protein